MGGTRLLEDLTQREVRYASLFYFLFVCFQCSRNEKPTPLPPPNQDMLSTPYAKVAGQSVSNNINIYFW